MSSEEDPNILKDNLKRSNSISLNNKPINKELLEDPYVKDLLAKLDVLKNGIIKERKTNAELSSKIKKIEQELTSKIIILEDELMSKKKQIITLTKEKENLEKLLKQQQLQQQQQQQRKSIGFFDNLAQGWEKLGLNINLNPNNEKEKKFDFEDKEEDIEVNSNSNVLDDTSSFKEKEEIKKLNEKIDQLKFENETYLQKMNKALEDTENKKLEYKNEIKSYTNKIKNLENENKILLEEKEELQDRIKLTSSISSQTLKETEHFKGLLLDYKKGKEEVEQQLNCCLEKCGKILEENEAYKQAILQHEIDSGKMAQKLAELKNLYIKVNLRNQMFHVKKEGLISYSEIDIIFGKGKDGNYVMRIDDIDNTELMNIQDVEYVNKVENTKNKVEISYMYNSKKYVITVIVDELIIDQFIEAYKIFYWESMKDQSNFNY